MEEGIDSTGKKWVHVANIQLPERVMGALSKILFKYN